MDDYSLVPVDHQPDFDDVTLVPVDHDPFSSDGVTQQPQSQPAQPQPPTAGVGQPNVGAPTNGTQAPDLGESWNPDAKNSDDPGPNPPTASASTLPPKNLPFKPFGELKPATFTPTQQIGNRAADALTALGMQPYTANDLAKRIGNVLGLTPLGVAGSALDLIDATHRGDLPGAITAAVGMIPDARGIVRGVAEEAGAGLGGVVNGLHVQFGQRAISPTFRNGAFAGQPVSDVAAGLINGTVSADQLPLKVITRDGVTYTMNNRSLMALRLGRKEPTILHDVTGDPFFEGPLTKRLDEMGSSAGPSFVPTVRKK